MDLEKNKAVVRKFNDEVIGKGDESVFHALMSPEFVNRSAPPGAPNGPEGMIHTFNKVLRPGLPDMKVQIHDQLAEADRVTTRKTIHGTHLGPLMGIAATGEKVAIDVIDIVRLKDGKYIEHWGMNNLASVLEALRRR